MSVSMYIYSQKHSLMGRTRRKLCTWLVNLMENFHLYNNIDFVQKLWEQEKFFFGELHLHIPESVSPGKVAYHYQSPISNSTKVRALCTGYNILLVTYTCTYCVWIPHLRPYRLHNLNLQETSILFHLPMKSQSKPVRKCLHE